MLSKADESLVDPDSGGPTEDPSGFPLIEPVGDGKLSRREVGEWRFRSRPDTLENGAEN